MKRRRFTSPQCPNRGTYRGGGGGGGGGGGEDRAAWPAAAHLNRRSHMMSKLAAVVGDWGAVGPRTVDGGRRTATAVLRSDPAACLSPKIFDRPTLRQRRRLMLAFLLFFRSSNCFLRFRYGNLRSKKSRYGNRFRSSLFIDVVQLLGYQIGSRVCLQCQGNL